MKRNKNQPEENYLEKIPVRPDHIDWSEEDGLVTLHIENKGVMNKIAQKLLKKPKISHIHLDEIGSFVWKLADGETHIADMGAPLEESLGEKAQPTYERLAKFFKVLESYKFIEWKK